MICFHEDPVIRDERTRWRHLDGEEELEGDTKGNMVRKQRGKSGKGYFEEKRGEMKVACMVSPRKREREREEEITNTKSLPWKYLTPI